MQDKFPDDALLTCPKCYCQTRVTAQVIQRDRFSPTDSDKIQASFLKHHVVSGIPMTAKEMEGLRIALDTNGFRAL